MAKRSRHKEAHSSSTKQGMGDYYGTGIRAKLGKMRDGMGMYAVSKTKMKIPPKSVV
jgi:hypothetical protein